jgi:hypothetical protein
VHDSASSLARLKLLDTPLEAGHATLLFLNRVKCALQSRHPAFKVELLLGQLGAPPMQLGGMATIKSGTLWSDDTSS